MTGQTSHGFVFHDPSGRRQRRASVVLGLVVTLFAAVAAGFAATLLLAPDLPEVQMKDPRVLSAVHVDSPRRTKGKPAWSKVPRPDGKGRPTVAGPIKSLTVGFYVSWDEASRQSLATQMDHLDVLAPQWVAMDGPTGKIAITSDPQADALLQNAKHRPSVLPLVHNAHEDQWDGPMADALLANPAARGALIDNLVQAADAHGYAGYILDLENLSPASTKVYPAFVAQVRDRMKASGRELWVTTPFGDDDWPLKALQDASDTVVLMAYDEHWATGDPGSIAGQDWYQGWLNKRLSALDPSRVVLALGAYGYDWTVGKKGALADAVSFQDALQTAKDSGSEIVFDEDSLNPHYAYNDDAGARHEVWLLDAVTLMNQVRVSAPWKPRGYAIWRMGAEDPGVWTVLNQPDGQIDPTRLQVLAPGSDVDFDGTGEILHVSATPTPGERKITVDPDTGLATDEAFTTIPTSYVIQRFGAHPGLVALTFDDGPDPRWTAKILDVLKEKDVKATFFVIGEHMADRPDLVKREIDEGHIVGNHTFTHPNLGALGPRQAKLELNSTQRLFETITGRSMRLLRPPYFGDAEPSTPAEVAPLLVAQKLGYLAVGLRIDPDDWMKPQPDHIVNTAVTRLADKNPETGGQVILLHDAGGDRHNTVLALPRLIDELRARGYRFVTIAELAGLTAQEAMPPTSRDPAQLAVDRIGFGFFHGMDVLLKVLFISAIALGVGRLVFLAFFALLHRIQHRPPVPSEAEAPLVSVLIPCFNEEQVIVSSIRRILASKWDRLEVLVLDDGSTDGTAAQVEANFAEEPRVRLMRFENGGKATALNRGLAVANGEIIVALDADTQFAPDCIAMLVRWFGDPDMGAVAGNAIVGNRVNLVTRWQALEYVTAQNLERRALAALGAVTVVPGAVGAWRKTTLDSLGGYPADTLAEDQDLTLAVQRAGWEVGFDPAARAYTEAPDSFSGLMKQRFRWSFGTLQCLWKHRPALFSTRTPILGFIALPQVWLFQVILTVIAPLVDLAVIWSLIAAVMDKLAHPVEWSPDNLWQSLIYWGVFVGVDMTAGALGMALEKKAPWRELIWLPVQRFGYRQMMYYVVVKAVVTAIRGPRVGWGKLKRTAGVNMDSGKPAA